MTDETVSAYGYVAEQLNARYEQGRADERRELLDVLAPIMEEAGQALFDDAQFRGASAFEVATGLQVVADALSMRGPIQYYDTLCGGDDA